MKCLITLLLLAAMALISKPFEYLCPLLSVRNSLFAISVVINLLAMGWLVRHSRAQNDYTEG